jgi:hypothetical protein
MIQPSSFYQNVGIPGSVAGSIRIYFSRIVGKKISYK